MDIRYLWQKEILFSQSKGPFHSTYTFWKWWLGEEYFQKFKPTNIYPKFPVVWSNKIAKFKYPPWVICSVGDRKIPLIGTQHFLNLGGVSWPWCCMMTFRILGLSGVFKECRRQLFWSNSKWSYVRVARQQRTLSIMVFVVVIPFFLGGISPQTRLSRSINRFFHLSTLSSW